MIKKLAIVFGVTGQDGSYLSEYLLENNYEVIGVKRRTSTNNMVNIAHLESNSDFHVEEGDVADYVSVSGVIRKYHPDEVYNLAAQSHVGTSFKQPLYTWDVTAKGVLNILEAIKEEDTDIRFYQASTSEMFGTNYEVSRQGPPSDMNGAVANQRLLDAYQDENTQFNPQSPYAIAKVAAHNAVGLYRRAYNLFGCCGILFNHESPRRGEHFVTRKISLYVANLFHAMKKGIVIDKLALGNLNAYRDWGHAQDYVKAMHAMLQQDVANDYVIATGKANSVRDFCRIAFDYIGCDYRQHIVSDPQYMRPAEVPYLRGESSKAQTKLNWNPEFSFDKLVHDMVDADISMMES